MAAAKIRVHPWLILKEPNTADQKFEDVVKSAEQAAVLVLVY
jgi:hypothetical protein